MSAADYGQFIEDYETDRQITSNKIEQLTYYLTNSEKKIN